MAWRKNKSVEVSVGVPSIAADAIDSFLQYGNGIDVKPNPKIRYKRLAKKCDNSLVNISLSGFIRFLISAYGRSLKEGSRDWKIANKVNTRLIMECHPKTYVSMKTNNYEVRRDPGTRVFRLIQAMVYLRIPIPRYYDAKHDEVIKPRQPNY